MAYDGKLAQRIRQAFGTRRNIAERKMFGGLTFLCRGHMCCGVLNDDLVVRVAPDQYGEALTRPHTRPMDFTGRALRGFVYVGPEGHRRARDLEHWLKHATDFVQSIPPKEQ